MTVFEQVKSAIDMKTVAEEYGLHIDRGGMTLCPFHNEKTPSAKIYGDNFHCFGCGEHHDIIGFTQKLFQLNKPIDSVKKLNTDFGLNIDIETVPTKADISEYQKRVNEQKAYREYEKNAWQILCDYLWLMREWKKRKLNTASKLWIDSEKQVLSNLMAEHGIEWEKLGTERTHLSVLNYKKQERLKEISQADAQLEAKQNQINSAEYTLSYIQEKVNEKSAECIDLQKQANEILNYIPNIEKNEKLENKFNSVQYVLDDQLKSSFTIMRSKDEIKKNVDTLENITKKALDLRSKSEHTIYDLHLHCDKISAERDDAIRDRNKYREKYERAERRKAELEDKISYFQDLFLLIETLFPNVVAKVKEIFKIRKNKECEQEQQKNTDRKNNNFELE